MTARWQTVGVLARAAGVPRRTMLRLVGRLARAYPAAVRRACTRGWHVVDTVALRAWMDSGPPTESDMARMQLEIDEIRRRVSAHGARIRTLEVAKMGHNRTAGETGK